VTVSLTINPVVVPVGNADTYTTDEDVVLNTPAPGVLGNDAPTTGLTAQLLTGPAHAANFILNADGSFSYIPAANYAGADSFVYRAVAGSSQSAGVTVTLTVNAVNDAPVAIDDGPLTVASGQTLQGSVLGNDTDVENDVLSAQLQSSPSAGALTFNSDGSFSYDATGVPPGIYSFTYRASDGQTVNQFSNTATVTIHVIDSANVAPVAVNDLFLFQPGVTRNVVAPGVLNNDHDHEGSTLSAQFEMGSLVGGGTLGLNPDGSFSFEKESARNGSFRYRVSDGSQYSTPGLVHLRKNAAPVSVPDICVYSRRPETVSHPSLCAVIAPSTVQMNVAANDTDRNAVMNVPSDGVGMTVVPESVRITAVFDRDIVVLANPVCGQLTIGSSTAPKAIVSNHCDGSVAVELRTSRAHDIRFKYQIRDDLGAWSVPRQDVLLIRN
jgi:hypothetical protein